jgi:hypothetical protein
MRESRTYGFVRGAHSDMRPYRDPYLLPEQVDVCIRVAEFLMWERLRRLDG